MTFPGVFQPQTSGKLPDSHTSLQLLQFPHSPSCFFLSSPFFLCLSFPPPVTFLALLLLSAVFPWIHHLSLSLRTLPILSHPSCFTEQHVATGWVPAAAPPSHSIPGASPGSGRAGSFPSAAGSWGGSRWGLGAGTLSLELGAGELLLPVQPWFWGPGASSPSSALELGTRELFLRIWEPENSSGFGSWVVSPPSAAPWSFSSRFRPSMPRDPGGAVGIRAGREPQIPGSWQVGKAIP